MCESTHVIIIGCGLVGSLAAHFMLARGYRVTIYEKREDFRTAKFVEGRSINLSMSHRARRSLKQIGLEDAILKYATPMWGRYIHSKDRICEAIPYDVVHKQCLYSISRNELNLQLIRALQDNANVCLCFQHKLVRVLPEEGSVILVTSDNVQVSNQADLIIAADGAFSGVRLELQKSAILDYSQAYINHGYVELTVGKDQGRQMKANHLHIWPRGTFMMIALPNLDDSWTVTLFMPFEIFDSLSESDDLLAFFRDKFPDFLDYTTPENLIRDFYRKKSMPLISIKCSPYNFGKVVLIGDAAHAMVPFYGQGMNAGFEDCYILNEMLDRFGLQDALSKFTDFRQKDAHAICDLAMYNYVEMRHLVATPGYHLRKKFDEVMYRLLPNIWMPLYNTVSFSHMGYKRCMENRSWQDTVIRNVLISVALILPIVIIMVLVKLF